MHASHALGTLCTVTCKGNQMNTSSRAKRIILNKCNLKEFSNYNTRGINLLKLLVWAFISYL